MARLAALALALLACVVAPSAAFAAELERPASETEPPRFFERTAREAERIAERADKVRAARRDGPLQPTAYTKGTGRWQVSFFRDEREVVQVQIDDRSGAILEEWSGDQVAWSMARGYSGAFGRNQVQAARLMPAATTARTNGHLMIGPSFVGWGSVAARAPRAAPERLCLVAALSGSTQRP